MSRDSAIEAGARALRAVSARLLGDISWDYLDEPLRGMYRKRAAAVIDAAAPHLTGEPIGYAVATPLGRAAAVCATLDGARHLRDSLTEDAEGGLRVVALVPVEDQP